MAKYQPAPSLPQHRNAIVDLDGVRRIWTAYIEAHGTEGDDIFWLAAEGFQHWRDKHNFGEPHLRLPRKESQ